MTINEKVLEALQKVMFFVLGFVFAPLILLGVVYRFLAVMFNTGQALGRKYMRSVGIL
jgi:hypothetical protein